MDQEVTNFWSVVNVKKKVTKVYERYIRGLTLVTEGVSLAQAELAERGAIARFKTESDNQDTPQSGETEFRSAQSGSITFISPLQESWQVLVRVRRTRLLDVVFDIVEIRILSFYEYCWNIFIRLSPFVTLDFPECV